MASASDKASQVQRRVRGLLNRMSDSNLPGIVSDMLQLTEQEGERVIADAVTTELLQANLQYLAFDCAHRALRSALAG